MTPHSSLEYSTRLGRRRRKLLRENWGVLSKIAERLGLTHETVRLVFWGRSKSRRVEQALKRHGLWVIENETSVRRNKQAVNVEPRGNSRQRRAA